MELRVLRYFVTVVHEQSISGAAQQLYITQPTLSRQLASLEDELGVKLLLRSRNNRRVVPTQAGRVLYERAKEILALEARARCEVSDPVAAVAGDVFIGGGETQGMRFIAEAAAALHRQYPDVKIHLYSGNAQAVAERMEEGYLDFGVFVGIADKTHYEYLTLPTVDVWGLVMRSDDPLAALPAVPMDVLRTVPLIVSQQTSHKNEIAGWLGEPEDALNIVATYNLLYNATLLVRAGLGLALALDGLAGPDFVFRPLEPMRVARLSVVWKRLREFSPAANLFLKSLRARVERSTQPQESSPAADTDFDVK